MFRTRSLTLLAGCCCIWASYAQVAIMSVQVTPDSYTASGFAAITVVNSGAAPVSAVINGVLTERGKSEVVADFRTARLTLPPGTIVLQGSTLRVEAFRFGTSPIARSVAIDGRLIPGLYELCVRITNDPAMEESDSFCEEVEVEDYGTLDLVYPWDGDTIEDDRPVLSWTRLDGKPSASVPAGYRLVLVEMRPGMDANASMQVGRPLFIAPGLTSYFVPYPNGVPSLVAGKCYAWEVQRTSGASISDRTGPWSFCLRKEDAPTPNKYVDLTGHGRIAQYEVVDDHVYFRVDEPYASHELQCVVLNSDGSAMHPDGAIASERGRPALKSAGVNLYDLDLSTYHLPRGNFELVVKDAKKKEYRLGLHVTQRP